MPYIDIESQRKFAALDVALESIKLTTPGELNYALSQVMINYLTRNGICYATMNDIVGATEGAKAEFQRRIVNPYESQKAYEASMVGGDIYEKVAL
jgi:hypothetical protein